MATKQATKPLPNGTSDKPAGTLQVRIGDYTGPADALKRNGIAGRTRQPSVFDDAVASSFKNGGTKHAKCDVSDADAVKALITELRRAAKFNDCGVDVFMLDDGFAFKARAKRERKAKVVA